MLSTIEVRNFAIIDRLSINFRSGMTVITGETGAGKSIIIDAIGLILGDRADVAMVREDSKRAEINAEFDLGDHPQILAWLKETDLDEDDTCVLRRTVTADGRSRAYINGRSVSLTQIRHLGRQLVEIHGQHEHQSLVLGESQRALLDQYAKNDTLLGKVATSYKKLKSLQSEVEDLSGRAGESEYQLQLLRYQKNELEEFNPTMEEMESIGAEHKRLSNSDGLIKATAEAVYRLDEVENVAICQQLGEVASSLAAQAVLDAGLVEASDLVSSALVQVTEATTSLRNYSGSVESDPERLVMVEKRLETAMELARKHRIRPEDLQERLHVLVEELAAMEGASERLDIVTQQLAKESEHYRELAVKLHQTRHKNAKEFATQIKQQVSTLGMANAEFEIEVSMATGEDAIHVFGLDNVEFLIAANPGQTPRPLSKVASGGELSRLSLAIQVVALGLKQVPTMIFDEIDVGIGGPTAAIVGQKLHEVAAEHQVFCVTHLPQVAAKGDNHLRIEKQTKNNITKTRVNRLEASKRVDEIARMLGGEAITQQSLAHAEEMLTE